MPMLSILVLDIPAAFGPMVGPRAAETAGPSRPRLDEVAVDVLHRPLPAAEEQVGSLIDDIAALTEDGRPLLVLYPQRRAGTIVPLVRLLRRILDGRRLVAVPTALPPLAVGVLVDLLRLVTERLDLDAGGAAAAVSELERHLVVVCWLGSVAHFDSPGPSTARHLFSWAARRGFELSFRPDPTVRRIRATSRPDGRAGDVLAARGVALRGAEHHLGWLRAIVTAAGLPTPPAAPADPATHRWFGTSRAAELVIFPANIDALATLVGRWLRIEDCAWCGMPGPGGPCAFCGADRSPAYLPPYQPDGVPAVPAAPVAPAGSAGPAPPPLAAARLASDWLAKGASAPGWATPDRLATDWPAVAWPAVVWPDGSGSADSAPRRAT
jgi:hypothetical protein